MHQIPATHDPPSVSMELSAATTRSPKKSPLAKSLGLAPLDLGHRSTLLPRAHAVISGHFGLGNAITGTILLAATRHFGAALAKTVTFGRPAAVHGIA